MSLNRLFEKQKHTVFYCPFMVRVAPGVGFRPSKAFNGQVHVSLALRTERAEGVGRAHGSPACVKGKGYQVRRVTSPVRYAPGTQNKGGFLPS